MSGVKPSASAEFSQRGHRPAERAQDTRLPLLSIRNLSVSLSRRSGGVRIVDDVTLNLDRGERLALVGESGSGKSLTAMSVLRLLPAMRLTGSIQLEGEDLLQAGPRRMRAVRGDKIGIVFQDPMSSLDPSMTIGDQVAEPLEIRGISRREARRRAAEVLDRLGVPDARRRLRAYPHEFSGGMRQRVCIATAVIGDPDLLIADEPTTALDVRVQAQVLDLLDEEARERGLAVLFITHDLGIVAGFADRVAVMYSGRIVEHTDVEELFANPLHPYTRRLLASVPRVDQQSEGALQAIPGAAPSPAERPAGCTFHPRCSSAFDPCKVSVPPLDEVGGRLVACHDVGRNAEDDS